MALVQAETVHGFAGLTPMRQVGLLIGLAASVALGVAIVLWSQQPTYSLLYGNLSERDASQVMGALQKSGIPYKIDTATGALMVPAAQVHEARLKLAADGLPKGSGAGFELLSEDQGFGTSQFIETARYQHALEGELSRTIATLQNVREARVHLAIPKRSVFLRRQEKPSASVVMNLYSGRTLSDDQVAAIVHLVASSVPRLTANDVTVVDQAGNLLSTRDDSGFGMTSTQFAYNRKLEQTYARRIENLLEPLVGSAGVRAKVAAELDFTQVEKTQESYNPDLPALRSEQVIEEQNGSGGAAVGVPGALSNQPPGGGVAPGVAADALSEGAAGVGGNSSRRATRNYELDKTISHTRLATGSVRRLSVAVVIDDKQTLDADGKPVRAPWSDEEIAKFTTLIKEAIGFNAQRGDSVQVINQSFQPPPEVEPLPEPGLLEQPWVWNVAKQAIGALGVLILIFGVIKPVMRNLAERGAAEREALAAAAAAAAQLPEGGEEGQAQLAAPDGGAALAGPSHEDQVAMARNMVKEDPKRVAQLMKNWVSDDG